MHAVELLLDRTQATLAVRRPPPESTYRIQFHAGFTFRQAREIVPYLRELGITHCYASPYLKARPGSTHGYDIVDHGTINPEVGSEDDYRAFVETLHEHGLGQIADIVPNHMGVATNENAWWNDVLENGPSSRYASHFDISWQSTPRELLEKVLLPVLGDPYGDALEAGQLRLALENGSFVLQYYDRRFPVNPRSYDDLLALRLEVLQQELGPENPALMEYESILTAIRNLPARSETDPQRVTERQREKEVIKRRLATLLAEQGPIRAHLETSVVHFNGTPGDPRSFDALDALLDRQCYRLCYWRVAADEINYRRFFDINDLAALSMERQDVFDAAHALILRLLTDGAIDGLRIDHPDGLFDPAQYLRRLQLHYVLAVAQKLHSESPHQHETPWTEIEPILRDRLLEIVPQDGAWPLYVVVEKILEGEERLRDSWAIHGTSGYDFLNIVNGLFVDSAATEAMSRLYSEWIQDTPRFSEIIFRKKLLILQMSLASELHMLAFQLDNLAQKTRRSRDFTFNTLRDALERVIASFPVYRSYISDEGVDELDRRYVEMAIRRATARTPLISRAVFQFIRGMLLLESPDSFTEADRAEQRRFAGKFQQVTSPVTAKGIEDTAFYVFNRFVSLNEVGGDPGRFGTRTDVVHRYAAERQARWPFALSPLSTHDTKRSEDVRARLNVLSEMPELWRARVQFWSKLNESLRTTLEEGPVPDANEEYFLYQTLVGMWPIGGAQGESRVDVVKRLQDYMNKALHEAKVHSSWINPNADYDGAVRTFVERLLDDETSGAFLEDFQAFQRRVSHFGLLNSLSQTVLKLTLPGVPDTYQGSELWDFSLVDPDNRRPVDFNRRRDLLRDLKAEAERAGTDLAGMARRLLEAKEDGRIKLYVSWRLLQCLRSNPGLFSSGTYLPLRVEGTYAGNVFAFFRQVENRCAVVAVSRFLTVISPNERRLPLGDAWADTHVVLPESAAASGWRNPLTGEDPADVERKQIPLSLLFRSLPVAVLTCGRE